MTRKMSTERPFLLTTIREKMFSWVKMTTNRPVFSTRIRMKLSNKMMMFARAPA